MGAVKVEIRATLREPQGTGKEKVSKKYWKFRFGLLSDKRFRELAERDGVMVRKAMLVDVDVEVPDERETLMPGPDYDELWLYYQMLAGYAVVNDSELTLEELLEVIDEYWSTEDFNAVTTAFYSHVGMKGERAKAMGKAIQTLGQDMQKGLEE